MIIFLFTKEPLFVSCKGPVEQGGCDSLPAENQIKNRTYDY